jgi:hypothetical protein
MITIGDLLEKLEAKKKDVMARRSSVQVLISAVEAAKTPGSPGEQSMSLAGVPSNFAERLNALEENQARISMALKDIMQAVNKLS